MSERQNTCPVFKTSIGGQALMEGIMMRGPQKLAYAVRNPQGEIVVEEQTVNKNRWQKIPLIRGVISFIESMITGYQCLMRSAEIALDEKDQEPPSRFEKWLTEKFGEKGERMMMTFGGLLGGLFAIVLFMILPTFVVGIFNQIIPLGNLKTLLEGIVKISILVLYMFVISKIPDIFRMFQYHGAEHKTITCYENGWDLNVENVRKCSRLHPRCGTSFLLILLVVSVILFSGVSWNHMMLRVLYKLLLLPVVMGISYEILKICGRYDNALTRAISAPGLWLQKITTQEPDDQMIECAITALQAVVPENREDGKW